MAHDRERFNTTVSWHGTIVANIQPIRNATEMLFCCCAGLRRNGVGVGKIITKDAYSTLVCHIPGCEDINIILHEEPTISSGGGWSGIGITYGWSKTYRSPSLLPLEKVRTEMASFAKMLDQAILSCGARAIEWLDDPSVQK